MLYMVIERFKDGAVPEIYRRFRTKGRMMPEGLDYISSWINLDFKVCWQLMKQKISRYLTAGSRTGAISWISKSSRCATRQK